MAKKIIKDEFEVMFEKLVTTFAKYGQAKLDKWELEYNTEMMLIKRDKVRDKHDLTGGKFVLLQREIKGVKKTKEQKLLLDKFNKEMDKNKLIKKADKYRQKVEKLLKAKNKNK